MDADQRQGSLPTLDWLRGVASLFIMFYHYFQYTNLHILFSRAFIAVDFFFMLSGFVLAYRYGVAIPDTGSLKRFVRARFLRLYPLYLAGTLLGAGVLLLEVKNGWTHEFRAKELEEASALATAFMPYLGHFDFAVGLGIITSPAFPLNVPAWSLFFELTANVLLAAAVFTTNRLLLIVIVSFLGLCATDFFLGDSNIGWGYGGFVGGVPRVLFSFFTGVLLAKLWRDYPDRTIRLSPFWLVGVLALDLSVPSVHRFGFVHYLASITIIFPVILFAGAQNARKSRIGDALSFLGRISYALYVVHYPVLELTGGLIRAAGLPHDTAMQMVGALASSAIALIAATALTIWFDEPIRKMLGHRPRTFPQPGAS